MNLALPALVILLGLLPGIAAFYGYFAGRFEKRVAGVSGVEEVALYIILAIPIDVVARLVSRLFGYDLNFDVAAHLLVGGSLSEESIAEVAIPFREHAGATAIIYFSVLFISYCLGSSARRLVWATRLDTYVSFLELKHHWFYFLQGRHRDLARNVITYADVLTEVPGDDKSRLYRGVVYDFEITKEGKIDTLTLTEVRRGSGRSQNFHGSRFQAIT